MNESAETLDAKTNSEAAPLAGDTAEFLANDDAASDQPELILSTDSTSGGQEDHPFGDDAGSPASVANDAPDTESVGDEASLDSTATDADGSATAESAGGTSPVEDHLSGIDVQKNQFTPLEAEQIQARTDGNLTMLMDLELPVAVELGRISMQVKDILELGPGAVVELNKFSGEPVEIYVNAKKFAEGEVVVVEQNFGVRITALIGPNEKLGHLQ